MINSERDCGIRPEHIDLERNKVLFAHPSKEFSLDVEIAELLGNEYYLHCTLLGTDFIARINNDKSIKQGEKVTFVFNVDRIHIFDDYFLGNG